MKAIFNNSINKKDVILKIDRITEDTEKSKKLLLFLNNIKELDEESGKANFFKKEDEKVSFINEVKKLDNYEEIAKDKNLLQNMINNNYLEFLLPYVMENDIDTYGNIEILGVGFYEDNQDIFNQ